MTAIRGPALLGEMLPTSSQLVGVDEEGRGGNSHDAGSQAVQAVDEVDGIGHDGDPQDRSQDGQVGAQDQRGLGQRHVEEQHVDAEEVQHRPDQDLPRPAWPGPTSRGRRRPSRRRRSPSPPARRPAGRELPLNTGAKAWHLGGHCHGHQQPQVHRSTARQWAWAVRAPVARPGMTSSEWRLARAADREGRQPGGHGGHDEDDDVLAETDQGELSLPGRQPANCPGAGSRVGHELGTKRGHLLAHGSPYGVVGGAAQDPA